LSNPPLTPVRKRKGYQTVKTYLRAWLRPGWSVEVSPPETYHAYPHHHDGRPQKALPDLLFPEEEGPYDDSKEKRDLDGPHVAKKDDHLKRQPDCQACPEGRIRIRSRDQKKLQGQVWKDVEEPYQPHLLGSEVAEEALGYAIVDRRAKGGSEGGDKPEHAWITPVR
jgi:hypothetical protein